MTPLEVMSWSLRGIISAPPGFDLVGADFSAIEARVLAWVAGQQDVLDILADPARDLYVEDAKALKSGNRQLGKVARLGLGYGMGPLKFVSTAAAAPYNVVLGLKDSRQIVRAWRASNAMIVALWRDLEDAVIRAIENPGAAPVNVGGFLRVVGTANCVLVQLPSGRVLRYWRPRVVSTTKIVQVVTEEGEIEEIEREGREIRFFVPGPNATDMVVEHTYGGKLTENVVQAIARDLLADAVVRLEAGGYPVVVHVHDSIVCEVREGVGSVSELCNIMATVPTWAPGLPLRAEGYRSRRFRG